MTITLISGTNTDVGKTIATAALALRSRSEGRTVCVMKPAQTGEPEGSGDLATITRLTGLDAAQLIECARFPEPLAPDISARRAGMDPLALGTVLDAVSAAAERCDHLLIEGAGGLLVRLGVEKNSPWTLADLGICLQEQGLAPECVLVTTAALGTLNSTELSVEALRRRGLECAELIIGSYPSEPELAERLNLEDLPDVTGVPLGAVIPAGVGALSPEEFQAQAPSWFRG
ncbi:dethiobiotin synthase [Corynebacterium uropygiale]|uniref:ATP-dependent dethiobiotin synthetase BioD n=1 Tax=Corynebacterium uropygiale TaxID=1775911 RepID=A0A9X1QQX4_9CORY|nr:dethiobiotin synthase [Corynebacterium uropygiale]MCF4007659.1 dethiobiotin synthase [Corynebacterium uropygiale]